MDSFPASASVRELIELALAEDIGRGDLTAEATVAADATATAEILQKGPGVLCGLPVLESVFGALDAGVQVTRLAEEGSWADERRTVARIEGPARAILSGERTALNLLQRLSGVATAARRAADAVAGTSLRVLDTRKTTPGMRALEKYAVRVGGCSNHRAGLDDGILIKENHIRAAGGITAAVSASKQRAPLLTAVQVEVTNLEELAEALDAGADRVLLDNFTVDGLRQAAELTSERAPHVRLEASGGWRLSDLPAVARTGVHYVSMGALTHSAGVLDFSLELL